MYNYIKGTVTLIKGDYLVLENNNIGYNIKMPNPFNLKLNTEYLIYTHVYRRDDIENIYGFQTLEERDLFLRLISVKGIGPKGALAIIASDSTTKVIEAIEAKDAKYLQRFPGIGPKSSQQIILDLYGKVSFHEQPTYNPKIEEISNALAAMGYKTNEIKKIHKTILENQDQDNSTILKLVLRQLI